MIYLLRCRLHCINFLFLLFITTNLIGQEKDFVIPDSLKDKSYTHLFNQARKNYRDTVSSLIYLNTALKRSDREDNKVRQSNALIQLSYYTKDKDHKLNLLKKAVAKSDEIHNSVYSLVPHYTLGLYYYDHFEYEKALQEYIKVLNTSKEENSQNYEHIALNRIAELKAAIGNHQEAITLYKKTLSFERADNSQDSMYSTTKVWINIAESMRHLKKHDSATYYYNQIITKGYKLDYYENIAAINEGINLYESGNFKESAQLLNQSKDRIDLNYTSNKKYYILTQFYLGKINQALNQGINITRNYFLTVDSLFETTRIVIPETRESYEFLISDYKKQGDLKAQLSTINKLVQFDSIISSRNINTSNKLHSEYDTPQLIKNREAIIKKLESTTKALNVRTIYLYIFIILLIILFSIQYSNSKKYKKQFNKIIVELDNKKPKIIPESNSLLKEKTLFEDIDESTVIKIVNKLNQFEVKKEFLKKNITLTILAKKCTTNTKYLPKIIGAYKSKSFVNYINDLRIDYILKELKENDMLRKYTIKTISEEAGFNTSESFARAFKNKTGIRPSYYIRNLKKTEKNKSKF